MKKSLYNVITPYEGKYLIFNTLSTSMVLLNAETYEEIFVQDNYSAQCVSQLKEMGILVDDNREEYLEIVNLRRNLISEKQEISAITILLTTACNARCYYCFEKGIEPYTLTFELCDAIINFIYEKSNKKNIVIKWFGGEPLLAFEQLKYINDGLEKKGLSVASNITTNGSLITNEIINYSVQHNLMHYQITIDDIGEKYNAIKNYRGINNAFDIVVKNIQKLLIADIDVSIRINYNIVEFDYAHTIYERLREIFGKNPKLSIYLAVLSLHGQKNEIYEDEHPYLKMLRYSANNGIKMPMWKSDNSLIPGNQLLRAYFLSPIGLSCAMECKNEFVINADGKLYKCHRLAGREEYSCGDVYSGMDETSREYCRYTNPHIEKEECPACSLLPLCHGGCKANQILYPECDNCSPIKNCIQDIIKTYYKDVISQNK